MRPHFASALRFILVALAATTRATAPLDANPLEVLDKARAERRAGHLDVAASLLAESIDMLSGDRSGASGASASALHRELGEILFEQKLATEASEQFELALRLAPGNGVLHFQAGLAYRMAGREPLAARHLREAVDAGFASVAAYLHLAGAEFASGNLSEGLAASRVLLGMRLRSVPTLMQLGRLLFEQFFYKDALRAFEAARSTDSDSYEALHFAALTNHLLNRHGAAVSVLDDLDPARFTAELSSLLAAALAQQGRVAEAEEIFRDAVERWPDSPHAPMNWALLLLERDQTVEAEAQLAAVRRLGSPNAPKVFYSVQRNSCAQVVAEADRSETQHHRKPARAAMYLELAAILAARQHHRTAVELLRLARTYQGNSSEILLSLAYSCLHIDPADTAPLTLLERAVEVNPALAEAHHLLGRARLRQGWRAAAIESHRTAVGLAARNSRFHTELGRAYAEGIDEADRIAAVESLARAADLDPSNALARYELGKLLNALGRHEEAIRILEEAVAAEPEFYNALYQLGRAYLRAGRRDDADRYLGRFAVTRTTSEARPALGAGFASGL